MKASREIITELLTGIDSPLRPLQLIAEQVQKLTDAEQAIVLTPTDADLPAEEIDTLIVSAAVGVHADEVSGKGFRSTVPRRAVCFAPAHRWSPNRSGTRSRRSPMRAHAPRS